MSGNCCLRNMSDEQNRILLEWFEDKAFLGKWISTVENLVQDILDEAERNLENIRNVLTSLLEQLHSAEEHALRMLPNLM